MEKETVESVVEQMALLNIQRDSVAENIKATKVEPDVNASRQNEDPDDIARCRREKTLDYLYNQLYLLDDEIHALMKTLAYPSNE